MSRPPQFLALALGESCPLVKQRNMASRTQAGAAAVVGLDRSTLSVDAPVGVSAAHGSVVSPAVLAGDQPVRLAEALISHVPPLHHRLRHRGHRLRKSKPTGVNRGKCARRTIRGSLVCGRGPREARPLHRCVALQHATPPNLAMRAASAKACPLPLTSSARQLGHSWMALHRAASFSVPESPARFFHTWGATSVVVTCRAAKTPAAVPAACPKENMLAVPCPGIAPTCSRYACPASKSRRMAASAAPFTRVCVPTLTVGIVDHSTSSNFDVITTTAPDAPGSIPIK